jgi:hypothetical protein
MVKSILIVVKAISRYNQEKVGFVCSLLPIQLHLRYFQEAQISVPLFLSVLHPLLGWRTALTLLTVHAHS